MLLWAGVLPKVGDAAFVRSAMRKFNTRPDVREPRFFLENKLKMCYFHIKTDAGFPGEYLWTNLAFSPILYLVLIVNNSNEGLVWLTFHFLFLFLYF